MKMWVLLGLFPLFCCAEEPFFELECEQAHYNERGHMLSGYDAVLNFKDGGRLTSHSAQFDQAKCKGLFIGGSTGAHAEYCGSMMGPKGEMGEIQIKGHQFQIQSDQTHCDLCAEEDVIIHYNSEFTAMADSASYHFAFDKKRQGLLHLFADSGRNPCEVVTARGDRIQGKQVWFDAKDKILTFETPQGCFLMSSPSDQSIDFSSDRLVWREIAGKVNLEKNVIIDCKEFGTLCADQALMTLDVASSVPKKIEVQGGVKMRNHFAANAEETTPLDQYALADFITYDPEVKTMTLKSKKGKRVLFYDKANRMQVSAQEILIFSNHSFKGKGDVRFTFAEQELEELRKRFPAYSLSP